MTEKTAPSHIVPLAALLQVIRDGDEHGFETEFEMLWKEHGIYMDWLFLDIQKRGIREPIVIGVDGRVWDGHHRLAVAHKMGLVEVPIQWAGEA